MMSVKINKFRKSKLLTYNINIQYHGEDYVSYIFSWCCVVDVILMPHGLSLSLFIVVVIFAIKEVIVIL